MSSAVFIAAITSALLHACWNLLAKAFSAPRDILFGISLATASLCAVAFPFVGPPAPVTWPWIAAASLCNLAYLRVLTEAYGRSEYGMVYAIVRASVPPVIFVFGWLFLTEPGRLDAAAGLLFVTISLVVFALAKRSRDALPLRAIVLSLVAGFILACALMLDVKGIRAGGGGMINLLRYGVASSLATATSIVVLWMLKRENPFVLLKSHARLCYSGAGLLLISYLCGMWAYAQGPVGLVAPLRESGILFSGALAVFVLRERVTQLQWAALVLATVGVVLVQMG